MAKTDEEIVLEINAEIGGLKADLASAKKAIKSFEAQFKKSGDAVQNSAKKTKKSYDAMGKASNAAAAGLSALVAATALLVKTQIDAARQTSLWARRLSIANSEMSKLAAVGKRFGASTDDVGDAIKDLNERIADAASGNKNFEDSLKMVGLASKDLIDLPVQEQFLKVADAIGKMSNAGDRNFVTATLMADAGFRLIPMFQQGEKAIRAMGDETIRTNQALSDFEFEQLNKVTKANRELSLAIESLGNSLTLHLAPGLKLASEWASALADSAREILGQSETAMRDRLIEINEQLDLVSAKHRRLPTGNDRTRAFTEDLMKYKKFVALVQERLQLEKSLASEESALSPSGTGTTEKAKLPTSNSSDTGFEGGMSQGEAEIISAQAVADAKAQIKLKEISDEITRNEEQKVAEILRADDKLNRLFEEELALGDAKEMARVREEDAHQLWLDRMFGAEKRAADQNNKLWASGLEGKRQVTSKVLGQISGLMNTNSKKQFQIGKMAAMAQVAIDTPKAAMSAYSSMAGIPIVGPALGVAAAAAAVASGASQMQNIKSQTFGGGGGASGAGISAGGATAQAGQAAPENVIDASFNITGQSVGTDQVRSMLGGLNELLEDGGKLRTITMI